MDRTSWKLDESRFVSYQGFLVTTFADAHFVLNGSEIFIQLHVLHASFEWLHSDVISVRGGTEKWEVHHLSTCRHAVRSVI